MYLIFDTETTGLPKRWNAPLTESENWPRCVQIAWQVHNIKGSIISHEDYLIQPNGFTIPFDSEKVHGISTALAKEKGIPLKQVLDNFQKAINQVEFLVGHNISFDRNIMGAEYLRGGLKDALEGKAVIDTCTEETAFLCKLAGGRGGKFKLPTLSELYYHLFKETFEEAHNATSDVEATTRVFLELLRNGLLNPKAFSDVSIQTVEIRKQKTPFALVGLKHENLKEASKELKQKEKILTPKIESKTSDFLKNAPFVHLHNHTPFSVLQATSRINQLIDTASKDGMPALAITDHGNLMGAFHFIKAINLYNSKLEDREKKLKPIIGCEFYVCEDHKDKTRRDDGFQIVFIAKNKKGYHNLAKMTSIAYVDGFYYVPRIDKKIVDLYKENLIVLTGNTFGEVPSKILNLGDRQAEEALEWWHHKFGDDLYIELMRHGEEAEDRANDVLIDFSRKHKISLIATNNTYYIHKEEANAHDILLCVKEGEKQATPIGRGRGFRYGFPNQEYYFKTQDQMKSLFQDIPEAILNIKSLNVEL